MKYLKTITRSILLAACGGALLFFTTGCEKDGSLGSFTNTEWHFVRSIDIHTGESTSYFGGDDPYRLTFDTEDTFSLSPSCNYSGGDYEVGENRISFTRIGPGTEMYCQSLSDWESFFLTRLSDSRSYVATGSTLVLSSDGHRLYFQRVR